MSFADAPILGVIVWSLLCLATLGVLVWSIHSRWRQSAGMRFPAGYRIDANKIGWRARLAHLPLWLRFVALTLLVIAIARPQLTEAETADVEGIDIVVAFDTVEEISVVFYSFFL